MRQCFFCERLSRYFHCERLSRYFHCERFSRCFHCELFSHCFHRERFSRYFHCERFSRCFHCELLSHCFHCERFSRYFHCEQCSRYFLWWSQFLGFKGWSGQDLFLFGCSMDSDATLMVPCIWHDGLVDIGDAYQNGKKWKCRACYGTERWLQKKYTQENRKHIWTNMSHEERAKEIQKNRGSHGSQGQKRSFNVTVTCLDLAVAALDFALSLYRFLSFAWSFIEV